MTAEKLIEYGKTTVAFLKSEAGETILAEMEQRYFAEFKSAPTPEAANTAWAKARALDDLKTALQAVVDAGTLEEMRLKKAESQRTKRPI